MVIEQKQIEEEKVDRETGIEEEGSREKYPIPVAQILFFEPGDWIFPE